MLLSTNPELRLHLPSNAVDDISILQGILDNSEKDFLRDKLGSPLYEALCTHYKSLTPADFYDSVLDGSYSSSPWQELLLNAQRMIANDAMARFAYQQVISINAAGVNLSSSGDYSSTGDKILDKGVQGFRKESMVSLNNLLILLEEWANLPSPSAAISQIVSLWKQSKYYFHHKDLLIPSCSVLSLYLDIYDNRDKFIRLIPDLRFIQKNYIRDAFGKDTISALLSDDPDLDLLDDIRTLITLYLEERTTVLTIDKSRRQQAHNEAVAKKSAILSYLKEQQSQSSASSSASAPADGVPTLSSASPSPSNPLNNRQGSKVFISPLLY